MCRCTPNMRTPFCGKPGCEWPLQPDQPRQFQHGTSYPIETLPDDLHDDKPAGQLWAIRDALFWNDCQGWWLDHISDVRRKMNFGDGMIARFWQPMPPDPMTREQILIERGLVVCPGCDHAIDPTAPHVCLVTNVLTYRCTADRIAAMPPPAVGLHRIRHGPGLMPRNFGLRRRLPAAELWRSFWNEPANDNVAELRWPYFVIGTAVLAAIAVGMFA